MFYASFGKISVDKYLRTQFRKKKSGKFLL